MYYNNNKVWRKKQLNKMENNINCPITGTKKVLLVVHRLLFFVAVVVWRTHTNILAVLPSLSQSRIKDLVTFAFLHPALTVVCQWRFDLFVLFILATPTCAATLHKNVLLHTNTHSKTVKLNSKCRKPADSKLEWKWNHIERQTKNKQKNPQQ